MKLSTSSIAIAALFAALAAHAITPASPIKAPVSSINPIKLTLTRASLTQTGAVTLPGPDWGTTPIQNSAAFPGVILYAVQHNTALNATFTGLPDLELSRLSTELRANDHAAITAQILSVLAKQLSAAQLVRLASAFGSTAVGSVLNNASSAVQAAYWASKPASALFMSANWYTANKLAQPAAQPAYDVYLNFRVQSSSATQSGSLRSTATFLQAKQKTFPIVVGVVAGLIAIGQAIDPNLRNDTITATKWAWQQIQQVPAGMEPSAFGPDLEEPGYREVSDPDGDEFGSDSHEVNEDDYSIDSFGYGNDL